MGETDHGDDDWDNNGLCAVRCATNEKAMSIAGKTDKTVAPTSIRTFLMGFQEHTVQSQVIPYEGINRWIHKWTDGDMDGWMDGWMTCVEATAGVDIVWLCVENNTNTYTPTSTHRETRCR